MYVFVKLYTYTVYVYIPYTVYPVFFYGEEDPVCFMHPYIYFKYISMYQSDLNIAYIWIFRG